LPAPAPHSAREGPHPDGGRRPKLSRGARRPGSPSSGPAHAALRRARAGDIVAAMNEAVRRRPIAALGGVGAQLERVLVAFLHARRGIEAVNDRLLRSFRAEALLGEYGAQVGVDVVLHGPLVIHNADRDYANLSIHDHVHIGRLSI